MADVIKNSFIGGIVDEALSARVDLPKYNHSCRELKNFILQPQGGVYRRPGLRFVAEPALDGTPSTATDEPTLVPLVYNSETSYIIALLEGIYKVYVDNAYLDEGVSTFTAEQSKTVDYAQSADVLFLVNKGAAPFKIIRLNSSEFEDTFLDFAINFPSPSGFAAVYSGTTGSTTIEYAITALTDDGQESLASFISVANGQSPLFWSANSRCDLSWAQPGTQFGSSTILSVVSCCPFPQGVALGVSGIGSYTNNFTSWTLASNTQFGTSTIRGSAYSTGALVIIAVGDGGKASRSLDYGVTWTAVGSMGFGTSNIQDVAVSQTTQTMIACGDSGKGARSTDNGVTWTPFSFPSANNALVIKNNPSSNKWLAGKQTSTTFHQSSDDGLTWTSSGSVLGIIDIKCLALSTTLNRWVASGFYFSGARIVYSDDDGSTWTVNDLSGFPTNHMMSLEYHAGVDLFISGWAGGYMAYSENGLDWTLVDDSPFGSSNVQDIDYCSTFGIMIAVGNNGIAAYSFDCKFWATGDVPDSHNIYKKANGVYGYIGNARGEYTFTDYNYGPVSTDSIPEAYNPFEFDYPGAIALFQQRLWFANTSKKPQTVFASRIGDFENFNFSPFIRPDDSIENTISSSRPDGIQWLVPFNKVIKVGTVEKAWTLASSSGGGITPFDINIEPVLDWGASKVKPVLAGNSLIYVENKGSKLFDLFERQEYLGDTGSNLSVNAPDLFEGLSIVSMAYQRTPDPILWCVRSDGKVVAMTYLKNEEIFGWHLHETEGLFKRVLVIPGVTYDQVYFTVYRNGKYLIEMLEEKGANDADLPRLLDSAVEKTSATPFSVVSGLDHLEGLDVWASTDTGLIKTGLTVTGGAVTLPVSVKKAYVGLPYTSSLSPLSVEYFTQFQVASLGKIKTVGGVTLRLKESYGGKIGPRLDYLDDLEGQDYNYGKLNSLDLVVSTPNSFNRDGSFYVVQEDPFPMNISALFIDVNMGER